MSLHSSKTNDLETKILTTELFHEAHITIGVKSQSVRSDAECLEDCRMGNALQRMATLQANCPNILLSKTAIPQ